MQTESKEVHMNTKLPMSCAALSLLVMGGAVTPTNVMARGLSLGGHGDVAVARGPSPQILRPDSLIRTSKAAGIVLTETRLGRGSGPQAMKIGSLNLLQGGPRLNRVAFAKVKHG
jgi:hypothetical protein